MNQGLNLFSLVIFLILGSFSSMQSKVAAGGIQNEAQQFLSNYLKATPAKKKQMLQEIRGMMDRSSINLSQGREDAFAQVSIFTQCFQDQIEKLKKQYQLLKNQTEANFKKKYEILRAQADAELRKSSAGLSAQYNSCNEILNQLRVRPQPLSIVGQTKPLTQQMQPMF